MTAKQIDSTPPQGPNLVPMVDIMFLLLLFFMLGADMGQRELEEVKLPLALSTKEEKDDDDSVLNKRLTINVYHDHEHCAGYESTLLCAEEDHWSIGIRGTDYRRDNEPELIARLEAE